jgi:hypothetical protein
MDAFDDVATLSPSSDEGVEVPANPQPPLLRPVAPSLSAIGGKPQGAESQDAYKTHGEGAEGDNNVTDAPNLDQTRANADRPERHRMVSVKRHIRRAPAIRAAVITKYPAGARSALVLLRLRGILSLAIGPSGAKRPTQNEQY